MLSTNIVVVLTALFIRHSFVYEFSKYILNTCHMNKVSGGDGIPAELFKILKDDAVKVLQSICCHILEKSVFIPVQKKGNAKESSNYHTIVIISHASKVMLKIL